MNPKRKMNLNSLTDKELIRLCPEDNDWATALAKRLEIQVTAFEELQAEHDDLLYDCRNVFAG